MNLISTKHFESQTMRCRCSDIWQQLLLLLLIIMVQMISDRKGNKEVSYNIVERLNLHIVNEGRR